MPVRRPQTTALGEARSRLEAVREDFAHAFEQVLSQVDVTAVATALMAWRTVAEAFAVEARSVSEGAQTYFEAQSEKWQDAEQGLTWAAWQDEMEPLADFDGEVIEDVHIRINLSGETPVVAFERDPSEALPESPDIPALEE